MTELPPDQAFIDVDRRLRQEVDRLIRSGAGPDPFRGLYIEDAEVFQLVDSLGRDAENGNWLGTYANRLSGLAHHFGLSPSQLRILVAAMAPDLDLRYERVFAYVQDDVQRKRPTIDLLLHLFWSEPTDRLKATWLFHAAAGLRRHRLIQLRADPVEDASLLASTIRTDPRVVAYVLGSDAIDEALIGVAAVCPIADEQQVPVSEPIRSRLASLADSVGAARPLAVVVFEGPPGAGKLAAARYLAARRGQRLLTIEVEKLLRGNLDPQTAAQLAFREAAFQSAIIYFRGAGGLWEEGERPAALRDAIMGQHRVAGGLMALSGPIGLGVPAVIGGIALSRIQLDMPSNVERLAHWSAAVGGVIESEEALSEIAGAFRLTRGQIDDAIQVARQEAIAGGNSPDRLTREELYVGCRAVSGRGLTAVADEITRHASTG
ncbi:MAG: hypothetical protein E6I84_16175 [Chloroflexi bacterium]|nr:MAG: hypothetical protein E6I84_16175 [Chloroflexota bacterium]